MNVELTQGDLFDQDVDVIVDAWNRNIIPWWLLLPQGVSRGDQAAWRNRSIQGGSKARPNPARRCRADLRLDG